MLRDLIGSTLIVVVLCGIASCHRYSIHMVCPARWETSRVVGMRTLKLRGAMIRFGPGMTVLRSISVQTPDSG